MRSIGRSLLDWARMASASSSPSPGNGTGKCNQLPTRVKKVWNICLNLRTVISLFVNILAIVIIHVNIARHIKSCEKDEKWRRPRSQPLPYSDSIDFLYNSDDSCLAKTCKVFSLKEKRGSGIPHNLCNSACRHHHPSSPWGFNPCLIACQLAWKSKVCKVAWFQHSAQCCLSNSYLISTLNSESTNPFHSSCIFVQVLRKLFQWGYVRTT